LTLKDKLRHWTKEEIAAYGIRRFKEDSALTDDELFEIGELDPADMLTPDSFADDMGNVIGEPQQYFVQGREPLPMDEDGNVKDPNDPD